MEQAIQVISIVASVATTIFVGIASWALYQTLGRVNDNIDNANKYTKSVEKKVDEHVRICGEVKKEVLEERIDENKRDLGFVRRTVDWCARCMIVIGTKLNINLPDQPN